MPSRAGSAPHRAARPAAAAALVVLGLGLAGLAGCAGRDAGPGAAAPAPGAEHGIVLTRSVGSYLVVMDLVPAEPMWTADQARTLLPSEGEIVLRGTPAPAHGAHARHLEVHVYDLRTGEPVVDVTPTLTLVDHTAGRTEAVDATLMHDLALGPRDAHFGTNLALPAGHRFTVRVELPDASTDFTGVLP